MAQGTLARHLFKCAGDSNLDPSQAEGPNHSSTTQVESHNRVLQSGTIPPATHFTQLSIMLLQHPGSDAILQEAKDTN